MNYIFNSSIENIENSDLILLVGTNPRHEATMLNARIRKANSQNKTPVFSIGNPGDLSYEYEIVGENTQEIKNLINKDSKFSKKFLGSKKPIVILGESALNNESGKYIFEEIKDFLKKNHFITEQWNALNILTQNASTVGLIDLKILPNEKNDYSFFDKLNNGKFKFLYLLGSDNLEIKKNNEFIVYQGCHGDRGAEIADVILPNAAYTEQSGLYENLEGRVQECRKASYPIGEAKEDWRIFNLIYKKIDEKNTAFKFDFLRKEAIEQISNFTSISELPIKTLINQEDIKTEFLSEEIKVKPLDYYYSNSISRASKTMSDCRQVNQKIKKTG